MRKRRCMENCLWRNTLFKQRGWLFFQERSKGCPTESLSVLFSCQSKGQIFLVLACDLLTEMMKCVKLIYAQIFRKQFFNDLWMLTSDRLREPEFQLGVVGTFQKNYMLLKTLSLGASFFFFIVLWEFFLLRWESSYSGKVHMLSAWFSKINFLYHCLCFSFKTWQEEASQSTSILVSIHSKSWNCYCMHSLWKYCCRLNDTTSSQFLCPAPFAMGPGWQLSSPGEGAVDPCSSGHAETFLDLRKACPFHHPSLFLKFVFYRHSNCVKSKNAWY